MTPAMSEAPVHSDYSIHSADGRPVHRVKNYRNPILNEPIAVTLAPGKYTVEARASGRGKVKVPVFIEIGRTTSVFLNGSWDHKGPVNEGDLVKLPGGEIIGWRASGVKN
jgi:hypothetical protein